MPSSDRSLVRAIAFSLAAGVAAGVIWSVIEVSAIMLSIGWFPRIAIRQLLPYEMIAGLVGGLLLIPVAWRGRGAAFGMGMLVYYGLLRIAAPPTPWAELGYLAVALVGAWIGMLLIGRDDRGGLLVVVHVLILGTLAIALAKVSAATAESSEFAHQEPSGLRMVLILVGAPLVAILFDRIVGLAIPWRFVRLTAEVVSLAAATVTSMQLVSTAPMRDTLAANQPPPGSSDVVIVVFDTTRADHMSTYGYHRDTTPNLTKLAQDGINFPSARSTAQWTLPGHASLFTGLFPSQHGAHYVGTWKSESLSDRQHRSYPLSEDRTTIAEVLRDNGWATGAFVANFGNLHRGLGVAQGFSYYGDAPGPVIWPVPHALRCARQFQPHLLRQPFRSATEITTEALGWLEENARSRPAFLFMNILEPHYWIASPPFDTWARSIPGWRALAQKSLFSHEIPHHLNKSESDFAQASYDGQIAAADAALGAFIDELKKRGRYENAIIVVTADHGELLGEHDVVGHGGRMMYEGLLHIPMVVKLPGKDRPRGLVIDDNVQQIDVMPTVLATLGLPIPSQVQGQPIQRVLHTALSEEHVNPEFVEHFGDVYNRQYRVAYDGKMKLITTSRGEHHLFDLKADPGENENLAARDPARLEAMQRKLDAGFATSPPMMSHAPPAKPAP